MIRLFGALIFAALVLAACAGQPQGGQLSSGGSQAPEFPGGHTWFNVKQPLTLAGLKGKAVLLDFWTLGCINCQQIIPDLKQLQQEFGSALVIIGVHSGKYDREHEDESVREAILKYGLDHPVVNDPEFDIWSSYGVQAWPTIVLIDPAGKIVQSRPGEGVYTAFQPAIAQVIARFSAQGQIDRTPIPLDLGAAGTMSPVLSFPSAVLADEAGGRLFIADAGHNRILVAGLDGSLRYVIGAGQEGAVDGSFADATFRGPQGLALSPDGGTLYIADTRNHLVRAADLAGMRVTTVAGTGHELKSLPVAGSPAIETDLASPWGMVVANGQLYIAMAGVHQVWTMDLARRTVSVFAGTGAEGIDDGSRQDATLSQPSELATDGSTLFWVDPESSSVRRTPLSGDGPVKTIVGKGLFDFGDKDGPADTARLQHPQGIAYANGLLYVADTYNHKVRTVDPSTGQVSTVAGTGKAGLADGPGSAAQLNEPAGVSAAKGTLYIADTNNSVVRLLDEGTGRVSTLVLSNLEVALKGINGRTLKVSLSGETASPDATILKIRLTSPQGYHLNSQAPTQLTLTSSNQPALEIGQGDVAFATDAPSHELTVPVTLRPGDAIITVKGPVYYCKQGAEAICLIDNLDLALPVTVATDAAEREVTLDYALPSVQG